MDKTKAVVRKWELMATVGEIIDAWTSDGRLTRTQIHDATGISKSALSDYCRDERDVSGEHVIEMTARETHLPDDFKLEVLSAYWRRSAFRPVLVERPSKAELDVTRDGQVDVRDTSSIANEVSLEAAMIQHDHRECLHNGRSCDSLRAKTTSRFMRILTLVHFGLAASEVESEDARRATAKSAGR